MAKVIASLSEQAWVSDTPKILNHLFSYYILTDSAQSLVFQDNLINLPATYHRHINDPAGMASAVKTDLDTLLSRYFPAVEVSAETKQLTESRYGISLYASVIDEQGVKVELARVAEIDTSDLRRVIEVNNYGDARSHLGAMV